MADRTNPIKGLNILIVEDSPTQAISLKNILEKYECEIQLASDGVDALQKIQKQRPDIVISDIEMPRMNGYDFCRHVKADNALKSLPVILLTNLTDSMDVIRGIECGADSFLTKPCEINLLLTTIGNILENKKLRQEGDSNKRLEFFFGGQSHKIAVDQVQITDLLLSTFSNAIQKNLELEKAFRKLNQTYEQLERKNEELKLLNKQKNQLLGMAAHDLRNPLGIIKGYSEFLMDSLKNKIGAEDFKMVEVINHSSSYMLQLINDLLDLAVIESGTVSLHFSKTNLPQLIQESLVYFKGLAEKKNTSLTFNYKNQSSEVCCDPNKVSQILNNLVSNAIKFSHPGGNIEISLVPSDKEILITVRDSGIGITPEAKANLFQPFSKASKSGTAGEKGTGLGLAIVHKIVSEHKGKIWVESELGKGSKFCVTLPVNASEANGEINDSEHKQETAQSYTSG